MTIYKMDVMAPNSTRSVRKGSVAHIPQGSVA